MEKEHGDFPPQGVVPSLAADGATDRSSEETYLADEDALAQLG